MKKALNEKLGLLMAMALIVVLAGCSSGTAESSDSQERPEEIRIFVRNNLAAHLAPKEIEVMAELPKTTISGKILRRELKQMEIEKVSAGNIV